MQCQRQNVNDTRERERESPKQNKTKQVKENTSMIDIFQYFTSIYPCIYLYSYRGNLFKYFFVFKDGVEETTSDLTNKQQNFAAARNRNSNWEPSITFMDQLAPRLNISRVMKWLLPLTQIYFIKIEMRKIQFLNLTDYY